MYPDFKGSFPCDFVIKRFGDAEVLAVGFARYDSTRGGAQSDDRTGGNANKVEKAKTFVKKFKKSIYIDLELPSDLNKLQELTKFIESNFEKL